MNKLVAILGVALYVYGTNTRVQAADDPGELIAARAAYQREIDDATSPIKKRYAAKLESMKRSLGARGNVQAALAVQRELDSLGIPSQRTFLEERADARLIIWNQNNGGKGDRGTEKINVSLRSGDKEIWRKDGIRMTWDKEKQSKETIAIPSSGVDVIRIEVTGLVNGRGGLAEVQLVKADGGNHAANCEVSSSGFWENNSRFSPAALIDGSTETFWLLPDGKTGWVEIRLKGRK